MRNAIVKNKKQKKKRKKKKRKNNYFKNVLLIKIKSHFSF